MYWCQDGVTRKNVCTPSVTISKVIQLRKDRDTALPQAWYPQMGSIRYGIQAKKGFNLPPDKHLDKVAGIYRQYFKEVKVN